MKLEGLSELFKNKKLLIISIAAVLVGILLLGGSSKTEAAVTDTAEAQLTEFLESIEGVGKCKVIITYKTGGSYYSKNEEVYAVAVCCAGAKRRGIEAEIVELVSSLYGIGSNRVKVFLLD